MSIPTVPAAPLKAAMDAAWPGLPEGMTLEEAERRTRAALAAAYPHLVEQQDQVLAQVAQKAIDEACERITDFGRATGDPQTARAYERCARGEG